MRQWFDRHKRQLVCFGPAGLVFCAAVLALLAAILILNRGKLVYTLDDAYIHLALAENIARGHYGVNLAEASAPSSSILWPFLLAPLAASAAGDALPLLINIAAALAALAVYARICLLVFDESEIPQGDLLFGITLLLLIPATNLIALIFTGMEHSLQLFLAAAVVLGMILESRTGRAPWWLMAAILLGPLVRYENLVFSAVALLYLLVRGHIRLSVVTALVLGACMAGFTAFLRTQGLGPMPSSILAKSGYVGSSRLIPTLINNLYLNLRDSQGGVLAVSLAFFLAAALFDRAKAERWFAAAIGLNVALHLVFGAIGFQMRYGAAIWTAALLALLYLYRDPLKAIATRVGTGRTVVVATALMLGVSVFALISVAVAPIAASNIYRQQYQMHRFVTEFYQAPVAVNDLGYVSYANDRYVLDLWGLASPRALQARMTSDDVDWMDALSRQYDVGLVMIYDHWFPRGVPHGWVSLGWLRNSGVTFGVANRSVHFYAVDQAAAERGKPLLQAFRQTLPPGVRFRFAGEE